MGKYILAHDLGTSGNKAVLYDIDGILVNSLTLNYNVIYSNNNWAEQSPDEWWNAVCLSSQVLLKDINPKDILAISFSGQMMGCVCVDKYGNSIRNSIIWSDMRATKEESIIRQNISEKDFYHITGHRISPSYGGQKFMWVKNNEPDIYNKTYKILNAKDYIILKLTGKFVTEYTDASSTCLLDLNTLNWSSKLIDIMEIDEDKLPQLCKSTDIAGYVTEEASKLTSIPKGTPVILGGGDGVCSAVGTGCIKEGIAHSSMGTSSWISITSKSPIYDEEMKTFNWAHIVPGFVLPTGTMQCGGGAYSWIVEVLFKNERNILKNNSINLYDVLEEEMKNSSPGSNGIIFLPYLMGERSPRWNPNAKGSFIGIKMENSRIDIIRSVLEGVAMNLSVILDIFKKQNNFINEIVVIGGGARSNTWLSIMSDIYGINILKPNYLEEACSMGAAITAGVGIGVYKNFDVIDKYLEIMQIYKPNKENEELYSKLKKIFNESYDALTKIFYNLSLL